MQIQGYFCNMTLIDTHTHLYQPAFDNDRLAMMERAKLAGVERFYLPGIDSQAIGSMLQMEADFPGVCFAMMGLHPCSVKENVTEELSIVADWLSKRSFPAVGEIGLDFYWDTTFAEEQKAAFHQQIEMALQYNLPIVIHTRNAMQATVDIVKSYKSKGLRGVFHCFSGSYESAVQILDTGFLLGIGGVVTYKNAGLREVMAKLSPKHIVLETDAPYLTPVPHRGKRNESSYLTFILSELCSIWSIEAQTLSSITTSNALLLYAEK